MREYKAIIQGERLLYTLRGEIRFPRILSIYKQWGTQYTITHFHKNKNGGIDVYGSDRVTLVEQNVKTGEKKPDKKELKK